MNGKGRQLKRDRSFDQKNLLVSFINKLFVRCPRIDLLYTYCLQIYVVQTIQVHCFFLLRNSTIFLEKFQFS